MCGGGTICKAFIGRAEFYGGLDLHFPWGAGYVRNILNLDSHTITLHLLARWKNTLSIQNAKSVFNVSSAYNRLKNI